MQSPDHASAPSASEGRCQPANRTLVAYAALRQPAATANHGRQRDGEIKSKLKASEVPMEACPIGYELLASKPLPSKVSSGTSARQGSRLLTISAPTTAQPNAATVIMPTKAQRRTAAMMSKTIAASSSVVLLTRLRRAKSNFTTFRLNALRPKYASSSN